MSERENQINRLLSGLKDAEPYIRACAVLSSDAFPLASWTDYYDDEDEMARYFSRFISAAEIAGEYFGIGGADRVYLKGERGYVVVFQVNENAHFACALEAGARMDEALKSIRTCALKLAEVI